MHHLVRRHGSLIVRPSSSVASRRSPNGGRSSAEPAHGGFHVRHTETGSRQTDSTATQSQVSGLIREIREIWRGSAPFRRGGGSTESGKIPYPRRFRLVFSEPLRGATVSTFRWEELGNRGARRVLEPSRSSICERAPPLSPWKENWKIGPVIWRYRRRNWARAEESWIRRAENSCFSRQ